MICAGRQAAAWMKWRLGFGLLALALTFTSPAAQLSGRVVQIIDGDTLVVLPKCAELELHIRLAGIDAPEKGMAHAQAATQSLKELAWGKTALVQWHKRDKYGRLVGKVIVDEIDLNLEQVKRGLAWHYLEYAHEQSVEDRLAYARAQALARTARHGLWQDERPQPPWLWRRQTRAAVHGEARPSQGGMPAIEPARCPDSGDEAQTSAAAMTSP